MSFNIPDPKNQISQLSELSEKYDFGKKSNNLGEVKNLKPVFAFDYLSLSRSDRCFNSVLIDSKKDYLRLLESFKKISSKTFDNLSKDKTYHFHDVDFGITNVAESVFLKCLVKNGSKFDDTNKPTVYQFKVFEEARIFGFFYKGVFYPVWLDRNHSVYKRK